MNDYIFDSKKRLFELAFNPHAGKWMLDTSGLQWHHLDRFKVVKTARQCFAVNLCHISAYDFRVIEDEAGNKAFLTVREASMGDGDLYNTDKIGFGYKNVVLYSTGRNSGFAHSNPVKNYVLTENLDGQWSVIKLTTPGKKVFTDVVTVISGCSSEKEALEQFKNSDGGVDLTDGNVWCRVDKALAEHFIKADLE